MVCLLLESLRVVSFTTIMVLLEVSNESGRGVMSVVTWLMTGASLKKFSTRRLSPI